MSRRDIRRKKQKRLINYLIVFIVISIILFLGIEEYKDNKIKKQIANKEMQYSAQDMNATYKKEEETKKYPKEEIPKEYKGYKIIAKLEIPKIELETFILSEYSEKALNVSVTKFWGADPNKQGNFCIAGHNVKIKNMFYNLRDLKIADTFWIIDNEVGRVEYEIYDIYRVEPEDVKCLSQETEGRLEATLITCTNDSKGRIIVKAKEKIL
ncbi:MAG: sortase [Clostridia bacterium]|jgi:LPXTG-site transpeptidase (sortase) family protein|nr:sortase [Clostridia bacterium]